MNSKTLLEFSFVSPSESDSFIVPVSDAPRVGFGQETAAAEAESDWESIAPELPEEIRRVAAEFVSICKHYDAFQCGSGCVVDRMEDSSVLFDWNDGHRPILSVLVTLGPKVVYAGRFKNGGKLSGEDPDLSFVTQPLIRMMEECGHQSWDTNRMPDSWWRVISGKAVVGQGSFFPLPAATPYPYSLPVTHQMQISKLPGYT